MPLSHSLLSTCTPVVHTDVQRYYTCMCTCMYICSVQGTGVYLNHHSQAACAWRVYCARLCGCLESGERAVVVKSSKEEVRAEIDSLVTSCAARALQHVWSSLPSPHDAPAHSDPVVLLCNARAAGMQASGMRNQKKKVRMLKSLLH